MSRTSLMMKPFWQINSEAEQTGSLGVCSSPSPAETLPPINRFLVKCRQIEDKDVGGIADCLARGFPSVSRRNWIAALEKLGRRPPVANYPKYGVLLEIADRIVGVLLQIFFRREQDNQSVVYCNLSSWWLEPQFRGYAVMLNSAATAWKEVTYLNISPAGHTRPIIEALGFRQYCGGVYLSAPALARRRAQRSEIVPFSVDRPEVYQLSPYERELLRDHAMAGCHSVLVLADGNAHPYIFAKTKIWRNLIPCAQLIYYREIDEFVSHARTIGRYLLTKGIFICALDSNQNLRGLRGRYFPGARPKYFKGPATPRLGDLSSTELALFSSPA
jgi:hypothetical protein